MPSKNRFSYSIDSVTQYISRRSIESFSVFLAMLYITLIHAVLLYRVLYLDGGIIGGTNRTIFQGFARGPLYWPKAFLFVVMLSNVLSSLLMQPWQLGCTQKHHQLLFKTAYKSQLHQSFKIAIDMAFIFVVLCMPQVKPLSPWIIAASWGLSMKNLVPLQFDSCKPPEYTQYPAPGHIVVQDRQSELNAV